MTEDELFEVAYNAHERAEVVAMDALVDCLREQSVDALACLADPEWRWETRGWMSGTITEWASEVLNEKLDAAVGAVA